MVLPAVVKWEHEGTSTTEATAGIAVGTVGNGPTTMVEDDAAVPLVVCRPGVTSVEHP
jgi:hypothetical protein